MLWGRRCGADPRTSASEYPGKGEGGRRGHAESESKSPDLERGEAEEDRHQQPRIVPSFKFGGRDIVFSPFSFTPSRVTQILVSCLPGVPADSAGFVLVLFGPSKTNVLPAASKDVVEINNTCVPSRLSRLSLFNTLTLPFSLPFLASHPKIRIRTEIGKRTATGTGTETSLAIPKIRTAYNPNIGTSSLSAYTRAFALLLIHSNTTDKSVWE